MTASKKVLIIEDDQYIREMYATILTSRGWTVEQAPDGAAGLVQAQTGGYAVILLDLMMPQMDGLTFLEKMKEQPPAETNGPIIVMSNLAYKDAKEKALALGAADFFVKADLEPKEVADIVTKVAG